MHPSTNSPHGGRAGIGAFLGGDMESPHAGIAPFCADVVSRAPQEGLNYPFFNVIKPMVKMILLKWLVIFN